MLPALNIEMQSRALATITHSTATTQGLRPGPATPTAFPGHRAVRPPPQDCEPNHALATPATLLGATCAPPRLARMDTHARAGATSTPSGTQTARTTAALDWRTWDHVWAQKRQV